MRLPRPVRRRNSIVLTSLVDVMFVLLFFFMLAASAVERRAVSIGMPSAALGGSDARMLRLDLLGTRQWLLDDVLVVPERLRERLRDSAARQVLIRPASGVPVQALADALTAVRDSGLELRLARGDAP